jgi:hypothetical protein
VPKGPSLQKTLDHLLVCFFLVRRKKRKEIKQKRKSHPQKKDKREEN